MRCFERIKRIYYALLHRWHNYCRVQMLGAAGVVLVLHPPLSELTDPSELTHLVWQLIGKGYIPHLIELQSYKDLNKENFPVIYLGI